MDPDQSFVIVGIGASAGGLEALEVFLAHLPADTGMAFVLVQHLDPGHASLMPELLARHTKIPIHVAENELHVEPNHFYVMPPNVTLSIKGGALQSSTPVEHSKIRTNIDTFLRSLAEDQTVHAVGVVLSGAGSDGTVGLKAIKENGGVTMVQSPTSAKYDGMPLSAISSGLVDFTLAVEQIPAKLAEHAKYLEKIKRSSSIKGLQEQAIALLPRICEIVHHVTGHDFSGYKANTMARRIERRLQVNHIDTVIAYVAKLEKEPGEVEELLKDFLIGVTQFFRDADAFDALARLVIPALLETGGVRSRVRVWVPGCASGEEAYSIAILLSMKMTQLNLAPHVQIFATDIDGDAINTARIGKYPASLVEQLSPERRERFFTRQGDFYQIIKPIRDLCVFSIHNLVRDPPFSSLDLISCRNLLIYMDSALQKRVIPLFHYALAPRGYLFLGGSEGLANFGELFRETEPKHRIFQRVDPAVRPPVFFPTADRILSAGRRAQSAPRSRAPRENDIGSIVARMALEDAPPCVVINERGGIIYSSGNTGLYLQQPSGAATLDVIEQASPALRLGLRTGIREVIKSHTTSVYRNLRVTTLAGPRVIDLVVRPLPETGNDAGLFVVVFQTAAKSQAPAVEMSVPSADSAVQQLETELKATRGELQTTVEDLETSNEELKSSNEELLSMNEELQSANEELQTSKEEMQSVNEELATVNAELNRKVEELNTTNSDLQNLFRSTDIATLFLDRDLRIKRFTPAATAIFRLIESDVGRPISDFASRLADANLVAEVRQVLQTLKITERLAYLPEAQSWFMIRILPSRTHEQSIDGVVVTFANITALKKGEESLRESEQRLTIALLNAPITVYTNDTDLRYTWIHKPNLGFTLENMLGKRDDELLPLDVVAPLMEMKRRVLATGRGERRHLTVTMGERLYTFDTTIEPQRDAAGTINGLIAAVMDVSDLAQAKKTAEAANNAKDHFLAALSHELRTPLTPVLTTSELLESDAALGPEYRDKIRMIRRNVELEVRLIDDLLDVTRIARNKIELHIATVDVHESITRVIEMCREDAAAKKIEVETALNAKPDLVQADPARFQQIIWNLLKNAIKFTPVSGRITINTLNQPNHRILIQMRDTGIGIDAKAIPNIFDAFEQGGREVTQKFGGLGLGLAITKALVELHGGVITAVSAGKNQGTTFNVDLPGSTHLERSAIKPRTKIRKESGCVILLVEDHVDTRAVMAQLLTGIGCMVKTAGSVKEALEVAETQAFNIVISDIGLPDGAGTELMRKLKSRFSLRSIALSGYGSDDDLARSKEAGFDAHLVKPINLGILEETVNRLSGG